MSRRDEDSGLIDLDALMKQPDASPRASVRVPAPVVAAPPPVVAAPVVAPVAHVVAVVTPPAPVAAVAPPAPVVTAAALVPPDDSLSASTHAPEVPRPASRRGRNRILAGVIAAGLAALVVARVAHAPGMQVAAKPSIATAVAVPAAPARQASPPAVLAVPEAPKELDPSSLPAAAVADSAHVTSARAVARPEMVTPRKAAPEEKVQVTASDLVTAAGDAPGDLGSAMRSAVGPRNEDRAAAEQAPGTGARQVRPSPGAVVGAINSVLPAARACLGPDDAIRKGSLVFRSDGHVARVDLAGSKTEDACIRNALAGARVEPFADDTFTTTITVRP